MALGTTGLVVTAALVAGAVGAGAAVAIVGVSGPRPAAPAPVEGERIAALEERLAKQDQEIVRLRARLDEAAHARPFAPPPRRGPDGPMGEVAPNQRHEGDPPTASGEEPVGGPELSGEEKERFAAYYREMREQEQEKARKARLANFETTLRGRLDRLPAELGLGPDQKDAAVRILLDRAERIRALFAEAGPGGGGPESSKALQERAEAIREETRAQLQQALTADQAKAVEAMASREQIGRGNPGARPGVRRTGPGGGVGGRRAGAAGGGEQPPQPLPPR